VQGFCGDISAISIKEEVNGVCGLTTADVDEAVMEPTEEQIVTLSNKFLLTVLVSFRERGCHWIYLLCCLLHIAFN
jgi:hypothetical protein